MSNRFPSSVELPIPRLSTRIISFEDARPSMKEGSQSALVAAKPFKTRSGGPFPTRRYAICAPSTWTVANDFLGMSDDTKSRREHQSQHLCQRESRWVQTYAARRRRRRRKRDRYHRCQLQYLSSRFAVESCVKPLDVPFSMGNRKLVQSLAFFACLAALAVCASDQEPAEVTPEPSTPVESKWGYYDGDPVTKWNPDGRTMTLITELRYTDPKGEVWVAPIGSVVDGASIPRYLWSIMGGPFEGQYRNASVLHDVAYEKKGRPWQDCDRMFYYAMRCSGVGAAEAKTMFYALFRFGHHWKFP